MWRTGSSGSGPCLSPLTLPFPWCRRPGPRTTPVTWLSSRVVDNRDVSGSGKTLGLLPQELLVRNPEMLDPGLKHGGTTDAYLKTGWLDLFAFDGDRTVTIDRIWAFVSVLQPVRHPRLARSGNEGPCRRRGRPPRAT